MLPAYLGILKPASSGGPYDLYAWGKRVHGIYGDGLDPDTHPASRSPILVGENMDIAYIDAGESAGYINSKGEMFVCGLNNYGQLGLGDQVNRNIWTQVPGPERWQKVLFTDTYGMAMDSGGGLWFAGRRAFGVSGDGVHDPHSYQLTWESTGINCYDYSIGYHSCIAFGDVLRGSWPITVWGTDLHGGLSVTETEVFLHTYSPRSAKTRRTEDSLRQCLSCPDWGDVNVASILMLPADGPPHILPLVATYQSMFATAIRDVTRIPIASSAGMSNNALNEGNKPYFNVWQSMIRKQKGSRVRSNAYNNLIWQTYTYIEGVGFLKVTTMLTSGADDNGQCGQGASGLYTGPGLVDNGSKGWKDGMILASDNEPCSGIGVKYNGTMWGWGANIYNGLGIEGGGDTLDVTQIGTDNDWVSIAGSTSTGFALKRHRPA